MQLATVRSAEVNLKQDLLQFPWEGTAQPSAKCGLLKVAPWAN